MPIPATEFLTLTPDAPIDLYVLDLNPLGVNLIYRFCNVSVPLRGKGSK
jgi:hypothetical protein